MEIIHSPDHMQGWALTQKSRGRTVGLIPTMGFLHEGHLSLIRLARARADDVVVSIFVNPTQFGPKEDFSRYPRDLDRDEAHCRAEGVDVFFCPDASAMYPDSYSTYVVEEALGDGLCGASRPGHFRGVATVVAKLFNLTLPDFAVFGEKDAQQLRIIRRLVRDLNFPVEVIAGPIAREADGLAMSSRNGLLSPEERREAVWLSRALQEAQRRFAAGERDAAVLQKTVIQTLGHASTGRVDYVACVDDDTLQPLKQIDGKALLALAVHFSATRLIDNVVLDPDYQVDSSEA